VLHIVFALHVATQAPVTDTVVAAARRAAAAVADTGAARAQGFVPLLDIRILDRTPFQGEHWYKNTHSDTTGTVQLDSPAHILFGPVNGELRRLGIAYATRTRPETPVARGLGGDSTAVWHTHFFCRNVPGDAALILVESPAECRARAGTPGARKSVMLHVWTDVPNPEGVYGHDNPALPYLAIGLTPPQAEQLHDPASARTIRALAMALAETYDARFPAARKIERLNLDASLGDSLRAHRAAIAARIPQLRQADAARDRETYDRIATAMIAEWEALDRLYARMALTPQLREQLRRMHDQALSTSAHH
jgi:hypothetical protein